MVVVRLGVPMMIATCGSGGGVTVIRLNRGHGWFLCRPVSGPALDHLLTRSLNSRRLGGMIHRSGWLLNMLTGVVTSLLDHTVIRRLARLRHNVLNRWVLLNSVLLNRRVHVNRTMLCRLRRRLRRNRSGARCRVLLGVVSCRRLPLTTRRSRLHGGRIVHCTHVRAWHRLLALGWRILHLHAQMTPQPKHPPSPTLQRRHAPRPPRAQLTAAS